MRTALDDRTEFAPRKIVLHRISNRLAPIKKFVRMPRESLLDAGPQGQTRLGSVVATLEITTEARRNRQLSALKTATHTSG